MIMMLHCRLDIFKKNLDGLGALFQLRVSIYILLSLAAFGRENLLDPRWMLDGCGKATNGLWHQILRMTGTKQVLFLNRVFHLHGIQAKRGGKSCVMRLPLDQWSQEIDRSCFLGHIYEYMEKTPDQFPPETLKKVYLGMIEGHLISIR